jgi:WD40 repeat protein
VTSVAFSSDGLRIVSDSRGYTVRIWDVVSGGIQHPSEDHTSSVASVVFSSNGSRILTGSDGSTALMSDAHGGVAPYTLEQDFLASSPSDSGLCSHLIRGLYCGSSKRKIPQQTMACCGHRSSIAAIRQQKFQYTSVKAVSPSSSKLMAGYAAGAI